MLAPPANANKCCCYYRTTDLIGLLAMLLARVSMMFARIVPANDDNTLHTYSNKSVIGWSR